LITALKSSTVKPSHNRAEIMLAVSLAVARKDVPQTELKKQTISFICSLSVSVAVFSPI
jgi:hypothetical protein